MLSRLAAYACLEQLIAPIFLANGFSGTRHGVVGDHQFSLYDVINGLHDRCRHGFYREGTSDTSLGSVNNGLIVEHLLWCISGDSSIDRGLTHPSLDVGIVRD